MCIDISRELLFHFEGLRTPKEVWEKLKSFFGKQYELRGHIPDNELIALHTKNFESIQHFFSKFKSLVIQCQQREIEKKDDQLVIYILSELGLELSMFVSTFHSGRLNTPNW